MGNDVELQDKIPDLDKELESITEDYSLKPVPLDKRRSWWTIFALWLGYACTIGGMYTGLVLGSNLPFWDALRALCWSNVMLLIVMSSTAYVGAKTGLSSTLLFRRVLGKWGTILFSLILALVGLIWFGVQVSASAQTWQAVLPHVNVVLLAVVSGLIMCITGTIGFKAMAVLSKIVIVPLLFLIVWGFIVSVSQTGLSVITTYVPLHKALPTVGAAISLVYGSWALGAAIMSDIGRYAQVDLWKITTVMAAGLGLGNFILPVFGLYFGLYLGTWDTGIFSASLGSLTFGSVFIAALIIFLAQWSTNDNNLYSASLALNNVIQFKSKWLVALIMGVIGVILGALGAFNYVIVFASFLGGLVPPLAAITISYYLVMPIVGLAPKLEMQPVEEYSDMPNLIWPSTMAIAIGIIVGLSFDFFIPSFNSLVATIISHIAFTWINMILRNKYQSRL